MPRGLYRPGDFKDNCGFGLIAHKDGERSHELLQTAIESLTCMTHRGGIAADGRTGDGCGLLLQKPDGFLRQVAKKEFNKPLSDVYAVGMIFLSQDASKAEKSKEQLALQVQNEGLEVVGWRDVPIQTEVCGQIALDCLPRIQQIFIDAPKLNVEEVNRRLFFARRYAEKALKSDEDFYICSLSATVLSYKGLVMPADLPVFYEDLGNSAMEVAICVFHQRFSTNTLPKWPLAQPFRYLAHNGEINTIMGNRNWSVARTPKLESEKLSSLDEITPLVNRTGSDSSSMDNMLEVLLAGGMDLFRAVRLMVPPAWQNMENLDADLRAFYEYHSMHMEPWDGPAGLVFTDGRYAVCMLDRNGLRPARWVLTKNNFITLASEIGTYDYAPEDVVAKGRVGPGQILAIDTETGDILHTKDIDQRLKTRHPYKVWMKKRAHRIGSNLRGEPTGVDSVEGEQLKVFQKMFQVTYEEMNQVLRPLAENGQEGVGSMGDDTPMAVLSSKVRPLTDYFRQQFAQVTNPPIDPLREAIVMSLETCVGVERNPFEETEAHADRIMLNSPILSHTKFQRLAKVERAGYPVETISLAYDPSLGLKKAIAEICSKAEIAVRKGKVIVVLSDRFFDKNELVVHSLLATGAVHHHLVSAGLRCDSNLILETAHARDSHHFATLLGVGATAVYPYLAYDVLTDMAARDEILLEPMQAHSNFRKGIAKGLLKILSKMGISTIASYRGAQLFEAVGLHHEIIDACFSGLVSRIEGATFADLEQDQKALVALAWSPRKPLDQGGLLKYVHKGEYHMFHPDVIYKIHKAVRSGDYQDYLDYADTVNKRDPATIRDLLELKLSTDQAVSVDDVEPIENILLRFDSAGMSLGALSPEAHESIAAAMNRLGGRSNSGEGGEDPARFGTERVSKIKQVASGRFGVTPHYLVNAEVLQIKVAQGAKPGEGGQLPGGKVNELIARLRYSVPGVTLISPPPHHDIYSIEDLAQLIFDLKQVNPQALVSVKLVSEPGVGTIAAGVAKAYADLITISGHDGGTAASPLTSIRYAGSPWELGLSEAQQALRSNDLRGKIRLQTDGGLKTGLDVVKAAILGAESFGFGTVPMVALGCKYLRICHLNNCATGVATQQDHLRENHYVGEVEMVMNFFKFVAQETREWLARLGVKRLEDLIGRTDLLTALPGQTQKQKHLDLTPLLQNDAISEEKPQYCQVKYNTPFDKGELAETMVKDILLAVEAKRGGEFNYKITNCNRSIGARLSGEIAKRYGNQGMAENPVTIQFDGSAGQSFGVWNAGGLNLCLHGDANDYVGKGMAGGKITLLPPKGSEFVSQETPIMGNTCLYGATGGKLFAAGQAGERFAVRNSGAFAVVEGVGDHCCEYMTGGVVAVLGDTGCNFGAGMTGGFAYVLDQKNNFVDNYNHELVDIHRLHQEALNGYKHHLFKVLEEFVAETQSAWGGQIIDNFDDFLGKFWLVKPKAAQIDQLLSATRGRPE